MLQVRMIPLIVLGLFLTSCSRPQDDAAIQIGSIRMSAENFDVLYRSTYPDEDIHNVSGRLDFLEEIIDRKLMLLEAERMGLDRDPQFLKEVQDFWQERLLKYVLRHKSLQYKQQIHVTDEEIQAYFDAHAASFKKTTVEAASENIIRILSRLRQQNMMEEWLKSLRDGVDIRIDHSRLGVPPQ